VEPFIVFVAQLLSVIIVVYAVYLTYDYADLKDHKTTGVVLDLQFIPQHNVFEISVEDDTYHLKASLEVNEALFKRLKPQDKVSINYQISRLSHRVFLTDLDVLNSSI
jgi:hypothetical protein